MYTNKSPIRVISLLFLSLSLLFSGVYSFTSGTGTLANPFIVNDCYDLNNISNYLSSNFTQGGDINCNVYSSGDGFDPIGGIFTGTYNGNGSTISNLFINRSGSNRVGLFNRTNGANLENITLINVDITGSDEVGGLVGWSSSYSSVVNSSSSGSVTGSDRVGGLVGYSYSYSSVSNSYSSGSVTGVGEVGGLVGSSYWYSSVSNSYSSGSVTGSDDVGGLVGYSFYSSSSNSSFSGSVTGNNRVGGLVGWIRSSSSSITNSFSSGSVTGTNSIGGLIGASDSTSVTNSFSSGDVDGNSSVGGLAGNLFSSSVTNSFSSGDVDGNSSVGGLVGSNYFDSIISTSFTTSDVIGMGVNVGGLVGLNDEGSGEGGTFANVTSSFWLNSSGNPSISIGNDSFGGQSATPQTDITYFYDITNSPFVGNWDGGTWNFTSTDLPFLAWQENPYPVSTGLSSLFPISSMGSMLISLLLMFVFFS
jgi:hypothetical protein